MTMKLYAADDSELMEIFSLERDGSTLLMKGRVFGSMPVTAKFTPREGRNGLRLLNARLFVFVVTFLFRR